LGPAEPIDAAINSVLSGFAAGRSRGTGTEARGFENLESGQNNPAEAWKAIQRLVVQPMVAALPAGTKRILLSPDSSLALAPFASLLLDMGSPVSVSIVPSAYDCARLKSAQAATGAGRAVIVGGLDYGKGKRDFNPLPGTESELKDVAAQASAAGFQTLTLSGSQATRAAIIDRIRGAQLLHLATHGFWSSAQSASAAEAFRSAGLALSLANSGSTEALLTAEDILKLDLSGVQLVVLSACTSGQGRPVDGQGLLGFQTAFMAAGAQSLLLSLWNVPDQATSLLMQRFYQALFAAPSISKSEALRRAQQQLRSDPEFADPRNWAAWVVVGDVQ
jgi:CHAT domain-containing protein